MTWNGKTKEKKKASLTCKYVIARRRSPCETELKVERACSGTLHVFARKSSHWKNRNERGKFFIPLCPEWGLLHYKCAIYDCSWFLLEVVWTWILHILKQVALWSCKKHNPLNYECKSCNNIFFYPKK